MPSTRSISGVLREALDASVLSARKLASLSGVDCQLIYKFRHGRGDLQFKMADKLAVALGIALVRIAEAAGSGTSAQTPTPGLDNAMRSAKDDSGLSAYELAKASRVDPGGLSKFFERRSDLKLKNADKVANVLGLKAVRVAEGRLPEPKPPTRRLVGIMLSAIEDRGLDASKLASLSGININTVRRLIRGESEPRLASLDLLAGVLGLKAVRVAKGAGSEVRDDDSTRSISDVLREAIVERLCTITYYEISLKSGVIHNVIIRFVREESSLELASVEKLFDFLGVALVRVAKGPVPDPKPPVSNPVMDRLRSAIDASVHSARDLAKRSGMSIATIHNIRKGYDKLSPANTIKLANVLGIELDQADLAMIQGRSNAPPLSVDAVPSERCPIELRGDGLPILLGKERLPGVKGDAYKMLDRLVAGFHEGRRIPASELAALSDTGRIRPLTEALDRPGLKPLASLIQESKEGRNKYLEILISAPTTD